MKRNKTIVLLAAMGCGIALSAAAQQPLPDIKFPAITSYAPKIKQGWVGQYVYELHFFDSLYYKNGKYEKKLWLRADNMHTGYIELPTEIKGAIRSNQPDKNNTIRWESWIPSGTSNSWSVINDTIKETDPIGVMGSIAVTGKRDRTQVFTSKGEMIKGRVNNADLQIDHTEKKYTLAVPIVSFDAEASVWGEEIYFNPAKRVPFSRSEKGTKNFIALMPVKAEGWDIVEGVFEDNQQEIVIRKRIPVTMGLEVETGSSTKLLTRKGYMDFYLVLKKLSAVVQEKDGQPAASGAAPATGAVQQQTTTPTNAADANSKKPVLGGLTKKLGSIIKNNR